MKRVILCICTYRRPEGLAHLLDSVNQLSPRKPDAVVVIDNHADGEGAAVCEQMSADYPLDLHYAIEAESGISFARNAAVELALKQQPDIIAFLDDDEWPEPQWLSELIRVCDEQRADAVGGPTLSVFPENTADEIINNPYYGADMNIADGARCQLQAAGNFLIKASVIKPMGPDYFRPEFAQSGGEDLAFFTTLAQQQAKMNWAANARVHEPVPPNRLSPAWLKERVINIANSRVRVMQVLEPGAVPATIRGLKTVVLFFQAMIWTLLGVFSKSLRQESAMLRWKFIGKLTAHFNHKTIRGEGH
jgi:glycosyltransferase involved in cell wall biosynthesis